MKKILIIGGGASGMAAACEAAKAGLSVTLIEKKDCLGKKLSITGNGRGNITNTELASHFYRTSDTAFINRFLDRVTTSFMADLFSDLGLLTTEKNGGIYPRTNQAVTVTTAFMEALKRNDVEIVLNCNVTDVRKDEGLFTVMTDQGDFTGDGLILACGSEASVRDKKAFSAYRILKSFNIPISKIYPALVPMHGKSGAEKLWQGIRTRAAVSYKTHREIGELQLTDKGVSGIPVFQISLEAVKAIELTGSADIRINFLPEYSEETVDRMLSEAILKFSDVKLEIFLKNWFPKKLVPVLLFKAGVRGDVLMAECTSEIRHRLIHAIRAFDYTATGYADLSEAQSVSGGVAPAELTDDFESKKVEGLYIVGELVDVTGLCGGYNLTFAFGSGILAGKACAEKLL